MKYITNFILCLICIKFNFYINTSYSTNSLETLAALTISQPARTRSLTGHQLSCHRYSNVTKLPLDLPSQA
ncbi:hypothetical protein CICLE_v10023816mg [Citrus x clementina]|uniref:Uncharacterized protein n=1 Tax=Citrus clementina TaxID=85681 RepID=V4T2W0_CITCL|nr:hypothetical protein CICLE_v10023816mg [Citrus x clementina]